MLYILVMLCAIIGPIINLERPRILFIINLIGLLGFTITLCIITNGFHSYGLFILYIFVIPAWLIVIFACLVYKICYDKFAGEKAESIVRMNAKYKIAIWAAVFSVALVFGDINTIDIIWNMIFQ